MQWQVFWIPSTRVQGLPSGFIPSTPSLHSHHVLCHLGASSRDKRQNAQGSFTAFQREFQAGHRSPFYRKMPFSHFSNPQCHQELTRNYHVPQGGKKMSLRRKTDIGLPSHPWSQFREAVGAANMFPEQWLWFRKIKTSPPKGTASKHSSPLLCFGC